MTTLAPETSRLVDYDRAAMVRNTGHSLALWRKGWTRGDPAFRYYVTNDVSVRECLLRVAMGAIGCDARDLRRCELDEIATLVADVSARPELWHYNGGQS